MNSATNKNRKSSLRLQTWDRWNGSYFITICTKNRENYFGTIINGEMQTNEIGAIAWDCWTEIPTHFSFITLGAFVIMPNHVHGILNVEENDSSVEALHAVGALHATPLQQNLCKNPMDIGLKNEKMASISPKSGSVSTIIRSYKSAVSKMSRTINPDFKWQSRFHDHIIRNESSFDKIQNYILTNPENWNLNFK